MNSDGTSQQKITDYSGYNAQFNWSPDGNEIVFVSDRDGNSEIYRMNIYTKETQRLTFDSISKGEPTWSFDGKKIAFVSSSASGSAIFVMDANGENIEQVTKENYQYAARPVWCPDDSCLIFEMVKSKYDIRKLALLDLETREIRPLLAGVAFIPDDAIEWYASVSRVRKYILLYVLFDVKKYESLLYAYDLKENHIFSLGVQGCAGDLYP
jgi:Tol biopolymer transport system component